jgi:hypothetical protein
MWISELLLDLQSILEDDLSAVRLRVVEEVLQTHGQVTLKEGVLQLEDHRQTEVVQVDERVILSTQEVRALCFGIILVLGLNASKDEVPKDERYIYFEFSAEHTPQPSHEREFGSELDIHEVVVESVVHILEEVMVDPIALLHYH